MTEKDLFREIGMIDEKYVEEAATVKRAKILTPAFRRTLATVACLCICVGIYFTVRTVKEESEESSRDSERVEMSNETMENIVGGDSNSKAESFEAIGDMFEGMAGASNSMSDGAAMDAEKTQEATEDTDYFEDAVEENEPVSSESTSADLFESIEEELAAYSNDYEKLCNGDAFVVTHGNISAGMDKWEVFMTDFERGNDSQVDVIRFTEEGDAIITRVCYVDRVFYLLEDGTRDAWGNRNYAAYEFTCMSVIKNNEGYTEVVFSDQYITDMKEIDSQEVPMYYLVQYKDLY